MKKKYSKKFRKKLGFTNQNDIKNFFKAKDIVPDIDYNYIEKLNNRLYKMIKKINKVVYKEIRNKNLNLFCNKHIDMIYKKLKNNNIIKNFNNQGRRPEDVYFSWMRGYLISVYFLNTLSEIFGVDVKDIHFIGDDDLNNIKFFKRSPKADLEINLKNDKKLRIEIQAGFQGINDIKKNKIIEARRIKKEKNISTIAIHFDLFNGKVAFVKLDDIEDNSINWIKRSQMEGQIVFNIKEDYFIWELTEKPPKYLILNL